MYYHASNASHRVVIYISSCLLIYSEEGGGNIPTDTTDSIDEGYASSITTDYSEEDSSESDYSESDDAESIHAEDEAKFDKGWDGKKMENIYYNKHTNCGGYAVILRNNSAQPIAARDNFSLRADHGCYSPYVRCNSRIVVMLLCQIASRSCKCKGNKIGKTCHRCASSIVPYMSDDFFETLVPLIEQLQDKYKYLGPTNFTCVSRKMIEAAHYLAKESKKEALSNKKELIVDYENGKLARLI
ncbi:hypothetical protein MKW92_012019 [Papaver armeniacum]|nr:hypothetical protein MKW92_012019 [Papaver armeniacum]